jgi:hypothetical protein
MFTLQYAKDPVWNSDDGQQIHLTVKFAEFAEDLPFNATSFDVEPHGRDLYNRAKAGEFGAIAPYVALPELVQPITTGIKLA